MILTEQTKTHCKANPDLFWFRLVWWTWTNLMVVGGHLISDFISDTKSILSFSFFFVVVVVVFEREERKESE